jgi:serine/threonine-protein kinase HipA
LGGLLHVDYNDPGASSYEEYLRTVLRLGMPPAAVIEGFRRMVFNVLAVNQDDHVKNLSFHMDGAGSWSLTPAYDLTFAKGGGWTATHQMRVADKRSGITRKDLIGVAETFGLRDPSAEVDRIAEAIGRWPTYAAEQGVPRGTIDRISTVGMLGLTRAFDRADRLSLALRARCFAWNPTLPPLAFSRVDYPVLAFALCLVLSAFY